MQSHDKHFQSSSGRLQKKRKKTTKTNIISFTKKKIKTVNFFIFVSGRWISLHRLKTNIKRKLIWTLKAVIVAITKLTLSSHNLTISTAKSYILHNNQKICWYWLRNNIENVIHVLFDCDNYYTLWQDTLRRMRTIDNTINYTQATSYKNLKFSFWIDVWNPSIYLVYKYKIYYIYVGFFVYRL